MRRHPLELAVVAAAVLINSLCRPVKCISTLPDTSTSSHVYGNVSVALPLNEQYLQAVWVTRLGSDMPPLKMLKRQIRCWPASYGGNSVRTITLVFLSSRPASVRWFKLATQPGSNSNSLNNMIPIKGNSDYQISYITSGRVTANTLTIQHVEDRHQLHVYETILTTSDGTIQYQLRTQIRQRCTFKEIPEDVDGPEWMMIPPPRVNLRPHTHLSLQCAGFVGRENTPFTNELIMSRAVPTTDNSHSRMVFYPVGTMHRDTGPLNEEQEGTTLLGRRHLTPAGHVIYHVSVSTHNATQSFEGVYQCAIVRQHDKLYVISTVTTTGGKSPLPEKPQIELTSCRQNDFNKYTSELSLTEGISTCVRCRAFADPPPDVAIYRSDGSNDVTEFGGGGEAVSVSRYLNVAEGGVVEVTYTIEHPTRRGSHDGNSNIVRPGYYHCVANNTAGRQQLKFRLKFVG